MFCSNCGKEIPDNSLVCPECGATLKSAATATQAATPVASGAPASDGIAAFIGIIVGAVGAIVGIIGTFLPLVQDSLGIGLGESLMGTSGMSGDLRILGIIAIVISAITLLFVLLRLKVVAIIFSVINVAFAGFICFATIHGMKDTYGLVKYGAGFYCVIAGAVILLVGSVLLKKRAKR